tara:strand:+ start:464 stop:1228 length:765 start_codon:yes stop_codon:yes gene_type:complete
MANGIGSHQSATPGTNTWLTPKFIIDALGPFDLDPCPAPDPSIIPTAREIITLEQDGLAHEWFGRVFLNPPYQRDVIGRWLGKLDTHGIGTALIFARTETDAFFNNIWHGVNASAALFLHGRLHFHYPDGTRARANGGAPSVLISYGAEDAEKLYGSGLDGKFVPINFAANAWLFLKQLPQKAPSWTELVVTIIRELGGTVKLADLYDRLGCHPKALKNKNWAPKVRQSCRRAVEQGRLHADGNGQYSLALGTA